ncbi:MAG TPA: Ig-like domain-containing protein [Coriobacteriia bacterium]|jgi:hypothetical protein
MKLSRSSISSILVAAIFLACLLAYATPAFASMDDTPTGTSSTNPNAGDAEWRQGWGNSLSPEFTFSAIPSDPPSKTIGFLYTLTRAPQDVPDDAYKQTISWDPTGAMLGHVFNLVGLYPTTQPGELEGYWFLNLRFFNESKVATLSHSAMFGVDRTPPLAVTDLTPNIRIPTESTRRTVHWTDKEYDTGSSINSGVYFYHLYLNDKPFLTLKRNPAQWLPKPYVTLEDLPPGVNSIGIQTEDRATNLSPMSKVYATVDPDWPELSVTTPGQGQWVSGTTAFAAASTDAACTPKVTFIVDGVVKAVRAAPPYSVAFDTRLLRAGHHKLKVESRDLFPSHVRTDFRDFYVDNTPIRIGSVSDSPDPFFPMIHDGIKDTTTVNAYLGETASDLYLQVYDNTATELVREYHWQNVRAGWFKCGWDGKNAAGSLMDPGPMPSSATFKYRLVAKDRGGNWTTTGFGTTTIRNYDVIPNPSGGVKVVPR